MHGTLLGLEFVERGGAIINMGSDSGLEAVALSPAYSASKHGVVAFSRAMAVSLHGIIIQQETAFLIVQAPAHAGRVGVKVMCLCPSYVDTDMMRNIEDWVDRKDIKKKLAKVKSQVNFMR